MKVLFNILQNDFCVLCNKSVNWLTRVWSLLFIGETHSTKGICVVLGCYFSGSNKSGQRQHSYCIILIQKPLYSPFPPLIWCSAHKNIYELTYFWLLVDFNLWNNRWCVTSCVHVPSCSCYTSLTTLHQAKSFRFYSKII